MAEKELLQFTDRGIWCEQADVYLDPWKPVQRALISHGHSDHAHPGMESYLCHHQSVPVLKLRLGENIRVQGIAYGETIQINGVTFSFHPAGHIWGSCQIRVEYRGEVWVFSGDYKVRPDECTDTWEPVLCHTFITECTFGLPVFRFPEADTVYAEINRWWKENREMGRTSILMGYALGKAQRLSMAVDPSIGPVYLHGAVANMNRTLAGAGMALPDFPVFHSDLRRLEREGALIIAPPSAAGTPWLRKFHPYATAMASGWMQVRGMRRRMAYDRGFILSDHSDWNELLHAVKATGAERVYATHGYTEIFARYLTELGYDAREAKTGYGEEEISRDSENSL